jgi:hypothetical protein
MAYCTVIAVEERLVLPRRDDDRREAAELAHRLDVLELRLHADRVLVGAGDHVDRAADQRLQRFGATTEIIDIDREPLLLEEAATLRDREGEVVQQRLATDPKRHLRLLGRRAGLGTRALGRERHGGQSGRAGEKSAAIHGVVSLIRFLRMSLAVPVAGR